MTTPLPPLNHPDIQAIINDFNPQDIDPAEAHDLVTRLLTRIRTRPDDPTTPLDRFRGALESQVTERIRREKIAAEDAAYAAAHAEEIKARRDAEAKAAKEEMLRDARARYERDYDAWLRTDDPLRPCPDHADYLEIILEAK